MILHIVIIGVLALILIGGVAVYGKVLMSYMGTYASNVGKQAQTEASTGLTWFWNKLSGWKTIIMSGIATATGGFAAIPSDALQTLISLPTEAMVADQKIAAWITTAIVTMIPIVHAQGMAKAASTPPQGDGMSS